MSEGSLKAKCRSRSGAYVILSVLDISETGCLVDRRAWSVEAGERVLIRLQELSLQPATIAWVEGEKAGIEFDQPLSEPVIDHLRIHCAAIG